MKKIYSCLTLLTFFASCADAENSMEANSSTMNNKEEATVLPAYPSNPYDISGQLFDEIFDVYYDGSVRPQELQSIITQIEAIADGNTTFKTIKEGHQPLSVERIQYLTTRSESSIASIIGSSGLSSIAKTSFINFLISYSAIYELETDAIKMYDTIVKYEETVIDNPTLTEKDKRVLLTTTSILRYSTYRAKKKPKKNTDPYWIVWVTHVFAAEEGAEENLEKGVLESLVTGIASN